MRQHKRVDGALAANPPQSLECRAMHRFMPKLIALTTALLSAAALAQEREVPYWASLGAEEINMRVGPSTRFKIDWVYRRPGLPVKVVRVNQGWRYVEDPDGTKGWIVGRLLSVDRGAIVTGEGEAAMRAEPDGAAPLLWNVEPGVSGMLGDCREGWCEFDVAGQKGWIEADRIWGEGEP